MPREIRTYKYDQMLRGRHLSEIVAIVAERASGTRRWYVAADNRLLEEEVARELFPNETGRYYVPAFVLKDADRREQDADGNEQITGQQSASPNPEGAVPRSRV